MQDKEWQLLALSPADMRDFFGICDPQHIPSLAGASPDACLRRPLQLGASGWQRIGPTCHAFAWVYRAPLMRHLLAAMEKARRRHSPPACSPFPGPSPTACC